MSAIFDAVFHHRKAMDILEASADLYHGRVAIVEYEKNVSYTYGDIIRRSRQLSGSLSDIGIQQGDRIAYLLSNRVECIDLYLASNRLGSIIVPLNWRLSSMELAYIINDIKPKVVVYESTFRDLALEALDKSSLKDKVVRLVLDAEPSSSEYSYNDMLVSKGITSTDRKWDLEEPRMILYTGGTTGFPKGAIISNRQILFNIVSEILTWELRDCHKAPILLPLFHTGGWNLLTLPLLARGGTLYFMERFNANIFIEIVETLKGPFVVFGVPTMYYMISNSPGFKDAKFHEVEWMMSGGAHIDVKIMEKFWDKGVKLAQGYGITEGGPNNLTMPINSITLDEIKKKWRSVGKPFLFNEIYIVDENGNLLGPNAYGEIKICGPLIFSGYWGKPEETRRTLIDGCILTGDIGYYDEEGYFYVVDRKKDLIKSGGEQIYPREIEDMILKHPLVDDCAVIGVRDEKWGEVPKLIVKLKPGAPRISKEELLEFLKGKIAKYKIPKYVAFTNEIPRSAAGKILKRILADRCGEPADGEC